MCVAMCVAVCVAVCCSVSTHIATHRDVRLHIFRIRICASAYAHIQQDLNRENPQGMKGNLADDYT